ncbi:transcriptional regulator, LysR family protein [Stappia aggregata IAM 12614]|uniref:Transcriptional regulator, LysR family protein n=1 Tax=Roseibium aggregatum (strain ATCC 25650 / DSM 13394 / JCM 20685 / NBRC 16684 / NCIMB 2208 / IAM 12614 / B1) TaxID=384765 RepID=A0P054_ROSAI|nr:hydrogen peroxide-inducible genes activator [Roseibium aggregatum]EAV41462.1 transcriptional regulator, LysR family protein [Stappia aggregata IAM 12614] [Roseibium aggregatum IAM 12614]
MTTLRQLRFLTALAETRNFSRAAELCHVTQSTLSNGLKELEDRLGVQVAERTKHSVMMTPVGEDLADRARDVLARVKDFEDRADREIEAGTTQLRLGAIPTIGPFLMPRAMPLLRAAYPDMKLYLREELTDSLIAGLVDGRLDLILIALPYDLPPQIVTEELFTDGYCLAVPLSHPLANRNTLTGEDLSGRELLLLEPGHCLQRHALSSFPAILFNEDRSFAATSLPTLIAMVEEGLGITLLPQLALDAGVAKGHTLGLSGLPDACPRRVTLAWRKSSALSDLFSQIGAHLRDASSM